VSSPRAEQVPRIIDQARSATPTNDHRGGHSFASEDPDRINTEFSAIPRPGMENILHTFDHVPHNFNVYNALISGTDVALLTIEQQIECEQQRSQP
jgi:hypothetical protein